MNVMSECGRDGQFFVTFVTIFSLSVKMWGWWQVCVDQWSEDLSCQISVLGCFVSLDIFFKGIIPRWECFVGEFVQEIFKEFCEEIFLRPGVIMTLKSLVNLFCDLKLFKFRIFQGIFVVAFFEGFPFHQRCSSFVLKATPSWLICVQPRVGLSFIGTVCVNYLNCGWV